MECYRWKVIIIQVWGWHWNMPFEKSAKDVNWPVTWLVYHYVEIPLCRCHITCWDGGWCPGRADRDPRPGTMKTSTSMFLFRFVRDTWSRLARSSVTPTSFFFSPAQQLLLSDYIKRFQTLKRNSITQLADTKEKVTTTFLFYVFFSIIVSLF